MNNMEKKKIFIVDDDSEFRELLKFTFGQHPDEFEVQTASTGKEALLNLEKFMPDAVILDITLPDISGNDILELIKADYATCHIPVVICSAMTIEKEKAIVQYLDKGAVDFITKPIDPNVVLARIKSTLKSPTAAETARAEGSRPDDSRWYDEVIGTCIECGKLLTEHMHSGICDPCFKDVNLNNPRSLFYEYKIFKAADIVAQKFRGNKEPKEIVAEIVDIPRKYFGFARVCIYLVDAEGKNLDGYTGSGVPSDYTASLKVPLDQPVDAADISTRAVAARTFTTRKTYVINDRTRDPNYMRHQKNGATGGTPQKNYARSFMMVPIGTPDCVIGVLGLYRIDSPEYHEITDREEGAMTSWAQKISPILEAAVSVYKHRIISEIDGVTGLYTHRYFQEKLSEEVERARRYKAPCSLIFLDIDDFKKFNDSYGHAEGDRVLKTVSTIVQSSIRQLDVACRYGGEELVVILPQTTLENAKVVAEKIRATVEANASSHRLTVSVGISCFPVEPAKPEKQLMIEVADSYMYQAKKSGKNKVCSPPTTISETTDATLATDSN